MSTDIRKLGHIIGVLLADIAILFIGFDVSLYLYFGPGACGIEDTCPIKGAASVIYTIGSALMVIITVATVILLTRISIKKYRMKYKTSK
jgi:uncharacterized membrane protein